MSLWMKAGFDISSGVLTLVLFAHQTYFEGREAEYNICASRGKKVKRDSRKFHKEERSNF